MYIYLYIHTISLYGNSELSRCRNMAMETSTMLDGNYQEDTRGISKAMLVYWGLFGSTLEPSFYGTNKINECPVNAGCKQFWNHPPNGRPIHR